MGDKRDRVVASIGRKLESLRDPSPYCCICKVRDIQRQINEVAFQPFHVSIGPFYCNYCTRTMQEHKLRYLHSFLLRNEDYNKDCYIEAISKQEEFARQHYYETVSISSEEFIRMVLNDAAFIIELFRRGCFPEERDENDPNIFDKQEMIAGITRDLSLEENQIPFFILKQLYDLAFGPSPSNSFIELTYKFFISKEETIPQKVVTADIKHLVDFLRVCHSPSTGREYPRANERFYVRCCPTVTELSKAGVRFRAIKSESLLDIRFTDQGVLEITRLTVTDDKVCMFLNIMVFEKYHHYFESKSESYLIDYFVFLADLISNAEDVEIFTREGIIENKLPSHQDLADLFIKYSRKMIDPEYADFYYSGICRDLKAYVG